MFGKKNKITKQDAFAIYQALVKDINETEETIKRWKSNRVHSYEQFESIEAVVNFFENRKSEREEAMKKIERML